MRNRKLNPFPRRAALVVLLLALALLAALPAAAQSDRDARWQRYDVALDLRADGTFHVTETQTVAFEGRFRAGFAIIPLDRVDSLGNVVIAEQSDGTTTTFEFVPPADFDEEPGTYTYRQAGGSLEIDYGFEPTSGRETRTFILDYDVAGGVRVYPDQEPPNQQIWWTAIASDVTEIAPVEASSVTLTLPETVDPAQVVVSPDGAESDGTTWTWQRGNLDAGDDFEVRLQFPPITAATVPQWQADDDAERQSEDEREERAAVAGVVFLGAGLLGLVGGTVALFGLWYARGRDPQVGAIAEFLPQPPDDLGPGAAGTLVDETTHPKDVIATALDLAHRGVLRLAEEEGTTKFAFGAHHDFTFTLLKSDADLRPHERHLLTSLFGKKYNEGASTKLSSVQQLFRESAEEIHNGFYEELVAHDYFTESPLRTRKRWRRLSKIGSIAIFVVGFILIGSLSTLTGWVWFPVIVGVVLLVTAGQIAPHLPKKTRAGAEAAAKWRAFKIYLDDIEKYEQIAESKQIFDRYLPFAVAFGIEKSWVAKFAAVRTPTPEWFGGGWVGSEGWDQPYGRSRRRRRYGGGGWSTGWGTGTGTFGGGSFGGSGSGGGVDVDIPDLQDVSDTAGRSLQSSSDSLFDMLNTAGKVFGGFSSGGSSRRGGWSGGGGFSGGGRSGGGGGGGSRGFR
ncbi:MAG: DUF2207 domain-containing protein [Chloroflexia bacterium]|nr:DUF2207 domain-containing protein [Chloroflexia bacterium]